MTTMMGSLQRSFLPAVCLGLVTGVLALIPMIGWLLGFLVFILVNKYTERKSFAADLIVMMLLWVLIRQFAGPLFHLQ